MNNPEKQFRELLQKEFEARKVRNPRYSLRAFGKAIGISHAYLSLFLRQKTPLTPRAIKKIAQNLEFDAGFYIKALQETDPSKRSTVELRSVSVSGQSDEKQEFVERLDTFLNELQNRYPAVKVNRKSLYNGQNTDRAVGE